MKPEINRTDVRHPSADSTSQVDEPSRVSRSIPLTPPASSSRRRLAVDLSWYATIALVSALIMSSGISVSTFWRDETYSAELASRSLPRLIATLGNTDAPHGLYYVVLHWWMFAGASELWIRSLSLLCGVLTVLFVAELVRRYRGRLLAFAVAMVLTCSAEFGQYAREARPYALACALLSLTFLLLFGKFQNRRFSYYFFVTLSAILSIYANLFTAIPIVIALVLWLPGNLRRHGGLAVLSALFLTIGTSPLLFIALGQTTMGGWIGQPGLTTVVMAFLRLGLSLPAGLMLVAVFGISIYRRLLMAREGQASSRASKRVLLVEPLLLCAAAGAVALPTFLLLASFLGLPIYVPRYAVSALPLAAIAIAMGLTYVVSRKTAAVLLIVSAVIALPFAIAPDERDEDISAAAAWVRSSTTPGDCIVYSPAWARPGFDYYLRPGVGATPSDVGIAAGGEAAADLDDLYAGEGRPGDIVIRLSGCSRVWRVGYQARNGWTPVPNSASDALDQVASTFSVTQSRQFGSLRVDMLT